MSSDYKENLKNKMDLFVKEIFSLADKFPKNEIYITVSQLKRAALSIILNYIESFARLKPGNQLNLLEVSYGSFKEVKYLLYFSWQRNYIGETDYQELIKIGDEIGAMLWTEIKNLNQAVN